MSGENFNAIAFGCSGEFRGQKVSSPEPRKNHPALELRTMRIASSSQLSPGLLPCGQLIFRTIESETKASLKSNRAVCFVANRSQAIEYRSMPHAPELH
jgi:hypothetical protein